MSTVLEQIEQQIAKLSSKAVKKNTGVIRTVADWLLASLLMAPSDARTVAVPMARARAKPVVSMANRAVADDAQVTLLERSVVVPLV